MSTYLKDVLECLGKIWYNNIVEVGDFPAVSILNLVMNVWRGQRPRNCVNERLKDVLECLEYIC